MPETTPLIKAALNLRVGAGFDVYGTGAGIVVRQSLKKPPAMQVDNNRFSLQ